MENVKFFKNGLFKFDSKQLFKLEDGEYKFIARTRKNIYSIILYNDIYYFMDSFGDCFILEDRSLSLKTTEDNTEENLKYLVGIISSPMFFDVRNDKIYALDIYSRLWICNLNGEIKSIRFLKENVLRMEKNIILRTGKEIT